MNFNNNNNNNEFIIYLSKTLKLICNCYFEIELTDPVKRRFNIIINKTCTKHDSIDLVDIEEIQETAQELLEEFFQNREIIA